MIRTVTYNGNVIQFKELRKDYGVAFYHAKLLKGDWFSKSDLVALADSKLNGEINKLPDTFNFGGEVYFYGGNEADIRVYID